MIYYILPPIMVIIGTAVLIIFLFRKISRSEHAELILAQSGEKNKSGLVSLSRKKIGEMALKMLERLVRRFKLYSLRLHNFFQNWFQSIRKKRDERLQRKITEKEENEERIRSIATIGTKIDETKIRPTISNTVVLPEVKRETKDRMEESLIERIATNPGDIEAYERLGDYYMEQANYKEAVECYKHITKLSPGHRKAKIRIKRLEKMLEK